MVSSAGPDDPWFSSRVEDFSGYRRSRRSAPVSSRAPSAISASPIGA
jgi:hypothetical protein